MDRLAIKGVGLKRWVAVELVCLPNFCVDRPTIV